MKKSLIALAVAGTFAAPAFAATSNVDVYGQFDVNFAQQQGIKSTAAAATQKNSAYRIDSNASRIGFKGSEDLGGGMKALWQYETGLNLDDNAGAAGGGLAGMRNSFLGLGSEMGTVLAGRHDTPYKLGTGSLDPFADTVGDYNSIVGAVAGLNTSDLRLGNVLAYISPTWSGFHFAAAKSFQMEAGAKTVAGAKSGDPTAYSGTAIYSNGPLFASLSYEAADNLGLIGTMLDIHSTKLGLGYTMGDTKFGFVAEKIKMTADTAVLNQSGSRTAWLANVAHNMGPITLKAAYGHAGSVSSSLGDRTTGLVADDGASNWAVGVDYNLSKRTKMYAAYDKTSNKGDAVYGGSYCAGGALTAGLGASGSGSVACNASSGKDPSVLSIGMRHVF
jgi:predicted porin